MVYHYVCSPWQVVGLSYPAMLTMGALPNCKAKWDVVCVARAHVEVLLLQVLDYVLARLQGVDTGQTFGFGFVQHVKSISYR